MENTASRRRHAHAQNVSARILYDDDDGRLAYEQQNMNLHQIIIMIAY